MDIKKIILIKPAREKAIQGQWYHRPWLGLGVLASFLRESGYECQIIDMQFFNLSLAKTLDVIESSEADFFGITAMTHEIERAHEIAVEVKKKRPCSLIAIGGPHCTALPLQTMKEFSSFDFGIFGEGEYTLKELVNALNNKQSLEGIKGLVFRKNGETIVNQRRDWIERLDSLPFPAWDLYPKVEEYPVFSSRGCPFLCKFCMRILGRKVRYRSPENVIREIEYVVKKFNAKRISFQDETFTVNSKRVNIIIDMMIERGLNKKIAWDICSRVTELDSRLCRKLKEAGCDKVGVGIESGNDEILKKVGKGITTADAVKGIKAAKKAGLKTEAYYILGHPEETKADIKETIQFAARLNTTTAAFGIMVPYPGTAISEMIKKGEGGYKVIAQNWQDFNKHLGNAIELEGISRKKLELLQIRAYLTFYIKNLRFKELVKYIIEKRKAVFFILKKLLF